MDAWHWILIAVCVVLAGGHAWQGVSACRRSTAQSPEPDEEPEVHREFFNLVKLLREAIESEDTQVTLRVSRLLRDRSEFTLCILDPKSRLVQLIALADSNPPQPGMWTTIRGLFDRMCCELPCGHGVPFSDQDKDRLVFDKKTLASAVNLV